MDTTISTNVHEMCVRAVDECITARNELGFVGLTGVTIRQSDLGVDRMTRGRADTVVAMMAQYGIKEAQWYPDTKMFRGTLRMYDVVISPTNVPLTRRADALQEPVDASTPPARDDRLSMFDPTTLLGSLREPIAVVMDEGLGVEITNGNRSWAEGEYESRLLASTGLHYSVKLDKKRPWSVRLVFDIQPDTTQL